MILIGWEMKERGGSLYGKLKLELDVMGLQCKWDIMTLLENKLPLNISFKYVLLRYSIT